MKPGLLHEDSYIPTSPRVYLEPSYDLDPGRGKVQHQSLVRCAACAVVRAMVLPFWRLGAAIRFGGVFQIARGEPVLPKGVCGKDRGVRERSRGTLDRWEVMVSCALRVKVCSVAVTRLLCQIYFSSSFRLDRYDFTQQTLTSNVALILPGYKFLGDT